MVVNKPLCVLNIIHTLSCTIQTPTYNNHATIHAIAMKRGFAPNDGQNAGMLNDQLHNYLQHMTAQVRTYHADRTYVGAT
jgi:hypothetical protein